MTHADDTPTAPDDDTTTADHEAHPQVVTPDGHAVRRPHDAENDTETEDVVGQVEEPAKVMRIGGMIKRLLDEVRDAPLDDAARTRLAEVHERSIKELEDGLSPDLIDELHRITLPFTEQEPPSDAELRVAHAQLVGWLEGLFHGIQTALVAQQMAAQAQLTGMRRALPPGTHGGPFPPGATDREDGRQQERGPGQYL
ncbi:bacterial proteasome activator family protein [Myceligenerans pegani]|uniref:Bacterial proteasome activator n=1 Tax=Myceligenerans pegani TaxID=2776917 RepID=A0ABR9MS22_9MICO|nr:bacterial proteasome activator family protein [Myceligenerans sp. TRM 65318]MBE1874174.1 bacterial proteasome activator family protein [Myceligenerans sp. TRM 65318]MBE3016446.1 bacterial proteasome activator family protein [Myceligenerans sp. TRM 65318]